jgi:hypothetical protein
MVTKAQKSSGFDLSKFDFKLPANSYSLKEKDYDIRLVCKQKEKEGDKKYTQYYYHIYLASKISEKKYKHVSIGIGKIDKKDVIIFVFDNKHFVDDQLEIKYEKNGLSSNVARPTLVLKKISTTLNLDEKKIKSGVEILFLAELIDNKNNVYKLVEKERRDF